MAELGRDQWDNLVIALVDLEAIGNEGMALTGYCGRGATTRECVAFVVADPAAAVLNFGRRLETALNIAGLDDFDPDQFFDNVRTDNMGRDVLLYFPSVTVAEGE
jgi:hypothetical protein